jgi:hypothetical protein
MEELCSKYHSSVGFGEGIIVGVVVEAVSKLELAEAEVLLVAGWLG